MTNTNQQEQLYRWVKASERLPEYSHTTISRFIDSKTPLFDMEDFIINNSSKANAVEWLEPYIPPVEDGKQGGEVSVEDVLADIISIRNKLYEDLPTGEMNAFELLQTIKWHINELDNYCTTLSTYKSQPSTPVQDGWVAIEDGCKLPVIPPPYKEDGCTITPMEVPILCHQDDSICLDWYNDSGIEWFQLKEYTHWQPLPSPPVNKQD